MGTVVETETIGWTKPALLERGLALWSTTTARQGLFSLIDQGVASATNFLTGIIVARGCSKEELGLYMLGFSLILLTADLQVSLIATPYMIYSPRLKGNAQALYMGSTFIHQLALCLLIVLALVGGEIATAYRIGPPGLGSVLWALIVVGTLIMLREYARARPILGYGYNAFLSPRNLAAVSGGSGWVPGSEHSGYIGTLLELGCLGTAAFVIVLFLALKRSLSLVRNGPGAAFAAAVIIWLCCNLFLEEDIIRSPSLPTFICMIILATLSFKADPSLSRMHRQYLPIAPGLNVHE